MRPISDLLQRGMRQSQAASARRASRFVEPELEHPYAGVGPVAPPGALGSSPAFNASMSEIPLPLLEWCWAMTASSGFCCEDSSSGCGPRLRRLMPKAFQTGPTPSRPVALQIADWDVLT